MNCPLVLYSGSLVQYRCTFRESVWNVPPSALTCRRYHKKAYTFHQSNVPMEVRERAVQLHHVPPFLVQHGRFSNPNVPVASWSVPQRVVTEISRVELAHCLAPPPETTCSCLMDLGTSWKK